MSGVTGMNIVVAAASSGVRADPLAAVREGQPLDVLTLCGFFAAIAALLCYGYRDHLPLVRVLLPACLAALSAYAFLQGAWPAGLAEAVWAGVAARRCFIRRGRGRPGPEATEVRPRVTGYPMAASSTPPNLAEAESRIGRLFGKF